MTPLDIARTRLADLAQGADPLLLSPADAHNLHHYLLQLEARCNSLAGPADQLIKALDRVELSGLTPDVVAAALALNTLTQELND